MIPVLDGYAIWNGMNWEIVALDNRNENEAQLIFLEGGTDKEKPQTEFPKFVVQFLRKYFQPDQNAIEENHRLKETLASLGSENTKLKAMLADKENSPLVTVDQGDVA